MGDERAAGGVMIVTDGRRTVEVPFEQGETVLTAMKRVIRFASPCGGNGWCGMCVIEVEKPNGKLKKEMACMLEAAPMTIHLRVVRPYDEE